MQGFSYFWETNKIIMENYQWQGEPVKVRFGYVPQDENTEKPMYWYNFECYNKKELNGTFKEDHFVRDNGKHFAIIPAIEVESASGYKFTLANHFGIGISKLIKGGWPNHTHFSLSGEFKESRSEPYLLLSFDLDGYEKHEAARNSWFKREYPDEYKKLQALKELGSRPHIFKNV